MTKEHGIRFEAIQAIEEGSSNYTIDNFLTYISAIDCYFYLANRDGKHLDHDDLIAKMKEQEDEKLALDLSNVTQWVAVSNQLPNFDETVLVYCSIYGRFLATYEHIGDFEGEKYGNWRDFKGNLGILPPVYWMKIPEPPCG